MHNVRSFFILLGMALFAALFVAGCSSDEGDAEDTASGASADASGASAAAADTGTAAQGQSGEASIQQEIDLSMTFTSPVFNEKRRIPKTHTCIGGTVDKPGAYFARSNLTPTDAQNLSPPLAWSGAPEGAQSFALIMRSTELLASDETWVHWVMWNIPADVTELAEGVEELETLANGASQGFNSGGVTGYLGPCPPDMLSVYKPSSSVGNENPKQEIEKYRFEIYALDTTLDLPAGATRDDLLKAMDGHILASGVLVGERQGKLIMKATG